MPEQLPKHGGHRKKVEKKFRSGQPLTEREKWTLLNYAERVIAALNNLTRQNRRQAARAGGFDKAVAKATRIKEEVKIDIKN